MSISNNHYDFKTISDLITLDHIKEALTKMKDFTKLKAYTKLNNETVQCLSRFSKNENDKNKGVICDLTYSKEHAQIQNAAISLNGNILQYDTLKKEETKRKCQIQVIINGELENFTPEDKLKFKNILAATLDLDSDLVSILEVKEGSVKLKIEMPIENAERLIDSFEKRDAVLNPLMSNFEIKEIEYYNEALIKEIYNKFYPQCENFILRNSGTKEDAVDIFHDMMIPLVQRIQSGEFNFNVPVGSFLYTNFKRKWLGHLIKKKRDISIKEYLTEKDEYLDYNAEKLEKKRLEIEYKIYEECFPKLSESCQEKLRLRFEGKSSKEISKKLNIPVNTVDQKLYSCRLKLKRLIEEHPDFKKLNE